MQGNRIVSLAQSYPYEESVCEVTQVQKSVKPPALTLLGFFQSYEPKSDIINMSVLRQSEYLRLKKYKDASFYGEFINGKRHGKGIMTYSNGRLYQGQWQSDFKHGKGYESFHNGSVYQGFYINGKPEGVGHFQWPNGQFYQGQWMGGLRHGSGMWSGAKGDSYVGEWKFGKADGHGVHIWINGDRYQGEFKQSLKHGQGKEKFITGDLYSGAFYLGKPHGYGEYYWVDGSFYKGNFRNGFRDGSGIWKQGSGDSDKYEGSYVKDKKQGYGIYSWSDGNVYKGHYEADNREGYGEMFWGDGSFYKGQWKAGKQEGEGTLYTPQQGTKKGMFSNNTLVEVYDQFDGMNRTPVYKKSGKKKKIVVDISPQQQPYNELHELRQSKHNKANILIREPVKKTLQKKQKSLYNKSKQQSSHVVSGQQTKRRRILTSRGPKVHVSLDKDLKEAKRHGFPHSAIKMKELDRRSLVGSIQRNSMRTLRNSQFLIKIQQHELPTVK